jgi:hypothetical protein
MYSIGNIFNNHHKTELKYCITILLFNYCTIYQVEITNTIYDFYKRKSLIDYYMNNNTRKYNNIDKKDSNPISSRTRSKLRYVQHM